MYDDSAYIIAITIFLLQNAVFSIIGIVATYRFLWKKIVKEKKEPPKTDQPSERERALEEQMREMRKMIEMLVSAQQEQSMDAVLNRRGETADRRSKNVS